MENRLIQLEGAQLIHRLAEQEPAGLFLHALIQESAYTTLLLRTRREIHERVAEAIERLDADHLDEHAAELARHYLNSGRYLAASEYAIRAGDVSARIFGYPEARRQYLDALDALARLPESPDVQRRRVDTVVKLMNVALRLDGPEASLARLQDAESILKALEPVEGDALRLSRLHFWMGDALLHSSRPAEAIGYLQEVLAMAEAGIGDPELGQIAGNVIGRALVAQGHMAQAEPLLARAAPVLQETSNWYEWVLAVGFLGVSRAMQGRIEAGLEQIGHALDRARELGTWTGLGDSHIFTAIVMLECGDYPRMLTESRACREAAERVGDQLLLYISNGFEGWAHCRLGDYDAALISMDRADRIAQAAGGQLYFSDWFSAAHAELLLASGHVEEAIARAEGTIAQAQPAGMVFSQALSRRVLAQALARLESADWERVRREFEESMRLFETCAATLETALTQEIRSKIEKIVDK
ncbi:MAG: hypothetical protein WCF84_03135 [Anaerolineae bacterium]